jgi:hypothetical protein
MLRCKNCLVRVTKTHYILDRFRHVDQFHIRDFVRFDQRWYDATVDEKYASLASSIEEVCGTLVLPEAVYDDEAL